MNRGDEEKKFCNFHLLSLIFKFYYRIFSLGFTANYCSTGAWETTHDVIQWILKLQRRGKEKTSCHLQGFALPSSDIVFTCLESGFIKHPTLCDNLHTWSLVLSAINTLHTLKLSLKASCFVFFMSLYLKNSSLFSRLHMTWELSFVALNLNDLFLILR